MILSNEGIRAAIAAGQIEISPPPEADQYTTSAVDLVVGSEFYQWDKERLALPGAEVYLDLDDQVYQRTTAAFSKVVILEADGSCILRPGEFMLGITREVIRLSHGSRIAARVEGRSTLARLGLAVHLTAPTIHAGFCGHIALEMINHGSFYLRLRPESTRICQLIFERLETLPEGLIQTQHQDQVRP